MIPMIAYKGKKLPGEYLEVRIVPDETLEFPLFAITITTKVSKNAVARNRIRRVLKVAIESMVNQNLAPKGRYIVLLRKPLPADSELNLPNLLENQIRSL